MDGDRLVTFMYYLFGLLFFFVWFIIGLKDLLG